MTNDNKWQSHCTSLSPFGSRMEEGRLLELLKCTVTLEFPPLFFQQSASLIDEKTRSKKTIVPVPFKCNATFLGQLELP